VVEYKAYGIPFPEIKIRMDQTEEGIQCLRGLLHDEVTNFHGEYFNLTEARNEPRPIQAKIPIWVGGGGEKRTLKIAARYADGWNVPFVAPEVFASKRAVLHGHCATVGRDPGDIRCAVNTGLAFTRESLEQQFGALAPAVAPGCLKGSDEEIVDRIGQYVAAGADQVNIALRAPFDLDSLERFAGALGLS
ncbi:MAG: LLM class flavin-dependent oxidoreductase, partial [Ilumatobacteraceae bacterium]